MSRKKSYSKSRLRLIVPLFVVVFLILAAGVGVYFQQYLTDNRSDARNLTFTKADFTNFPSRWDHLSHLIGNFGGKPVYRQAFATGLVPFYGSDGVTPNSAAYSQRFNKTFISYPAGAKRITQQMLADFYPHENTSVNPFIVVFDHATGQYEGPYKLANVGKINDQHNYPVLVEDANGYLHVFYSYHNDRGSTTGDYRAITHFKSKKPGDVSSWDVKDVPNTEHHTYLQIIKDRKGGFHAFYRKTGDEYRNPAAKDKRHFYEPTMYLSSVDNGNSWSKPREIVQPPRYNQGVSGPEGWNTIYIRAFQLDPFKNRIWFTFRESQWHNEAVRRYFVAYLNIDDGKLYTAGNTDLGSEITWQELEKEKQLQYFSYNGTHLQGRRFGAGKELLLFTQASSAPELLITRYFSPHSIAETEKYYSKGYYQPNQLRYVAGQGWTSLGVPQVFANQQMFTITSTFHQGSNYIFYNNPGTISEEFILDRDINSFVGRISTLEPLQIEKIHLFQEDQKSWLVNGTSYFNFIPGSNQLIGMAIVPKYLWWTGAKNGQELVERSNALADWFGLPPIGAGYLVLQQKSQLRVDGKTESLPEEEKFCALTARSQAPSCNSWKTLTINGCDLSSWQKKTSYCNSTSVDRSVWLHIQNPEASHARYINVKAEQLCEKLTGNESEWSPWEEIAYFKHWQLAASGERRKVCAQFATRCSKNNTEVKSSFCGAVISVKK
jgi:hypothetical protein